MANCTLWIDMHKPLPSVRITALICFMLSKCVALWHVWVLVPHLASMCKTVRERQGLASFFLLIFLFYFDLLFNESSWLACYQVCFAWSCFCFVCVVTVLTAFMHTSCRWWPCVRLSSFRQNHEQLLSWLLLLSSFQRTLLCLIRWPRPTKASDFHF